MITIYKYKLQAAPGAEAISMHEGAQILSIDLQSGRPCIWAKVDTNTPMERRLVNKLQTGEAIDYHALDGMSFVGTVQLLLGDLVLHVYINTPMYDQGREQVAVRKPDATALLALKRIASFTAELPRAEDIERFKRDVEYILDKFRSMGVV